MPLALVFQALIATFLIAIGAPAARAQAPQPVPALSARVIDTTGTLAPAERQSLETQLAAIEQQHGSQVAVLMVPTTAPEDIAAYANRVGNAWKIGRRNVGDGVLVVVAKDDRKMRIEVAKALEGAIPDIAAARIIDAAMKPRFRQNDFAGGLTAAVDQIGARIAGEPLPLPEPPGDRRQHGGTASGFDWMDLGIFLFFGVMIGGPIARSLFGAGKGGLLMGAGVGGLAFLLTASALLSAGAGLLALAYTALFSAAGRAGHSSGPGITWGSSGGGGSWSSGSSSSGSGGGFSSGGGGDFGGGGASGDW